MKKLRRICIFTETYFPVVGGGETQAQLLANGLTARGHSVMILTRRSDKSLAKFEHMGVVSVYRLPPAGGGQLKKWGLIFSSFPKLFLLRKHFDVIFISGFRIVGITAILISKLTQKKCVLKADSQGEMSGDFFKNGLERLGFSRSWLPFRIFLRLRNHILRKADAFSAISDEIASELSSNGISSEKIHMIPNSVDTSRYFPVDAERKVLLREKLGLPQTDTIVIYTGRLVSYKGLPLLVKVWKAIFDQYSNVRLLLLGTGGLDIHNCEAELRSFVREHCLDQTVDFTGNVRNVEEYLQASDIFAFPTENDAFPSSLIEAMTCALPVITTQVGAIKTIVSHGENGLIVQPGNFQELYTAIETLIIDGDLKTSLGQAAWKDVRNRYSEDIVTEKYQKLFQSLAIN